VPRLRLVGGELQEEVAESQIDASAKVNGEFSVSSPSLAIRRILIMQAVGW
jgi:hypothetical protein